MEHCLKVMKMIPSQGFDIEYYKIKTKLLRTKSLPRLLSMQSKDYFVHSTNIMYF